MRIPSSTYRLQLSPGFTLDDARGAAPYLRELGTGDLYLSPVLEARPGSEHGYDVTDPTRVREELGGEGALRRLAKAARELDMGVVVDVVPNHMAADHRNPWWWQVLRDGRESRHAGTFDIDWDAPGLGGRVLVPVLGEPAGDALRAGRLEVVEEDGERRLAYFDRRFPLMPGSEGLEPADLLAAQHYELAFWRDAAARINYRRFFDISDLIALRAEREEVFEATHGKLLELVADGVVTGMRIDHVDGLRAPEAYLRRLRERAGPEVHVVVEKILGRHERLRAAWPVAGTTGYEFLAAAGGLFVDPAGASRAGEAYVAQTGAQPDFHALAVAEKRRALRELFPADLDRVLRLALEALPGAEPQTLRAALAELSAQLPAYRTYLGETPAVEDAELLAVAAKAARTALAGPSRAALDDLVGVLGCALDGPAERFALAWQQLTGPVAAKGVEDTALYADARLVARNEPGLDPGWITTGVEEFHIRCGQVAGHPLNTTSTHDTKRSEDVRARITALTQLPDWPGAVLRWRELNAGRRVRPGDGPDAVEEWLLYQTLIGVWPVDGSAQDIQPRVAAYMTKALREARRHSSWLSPDEAYEAQVQGFLAAVLAPENRRFRDELDALAGQAAGVGMRISLGTLALKLAAPGVPDIYWGNELLDLSLVDPDNRRAVDFAGRRGLVAELAAAAEADLPGLCRDLAGDLTGRAKLLLTLRGLDLRRRRARLFARGEYVPLTAVGPRAGDIVAFARRHGEEWAVAAVPRMSGLPDWQGTAVRLPAGAPAVWVDAVTGARHESRELQAAALFGGIGVALLECSGPPEGE